MRLVFQYVAAARVVCGSETIRIPSRLRRHFLTVNLDALLDSWRAVSSFVAGFNTCGR
jgi:hypothetical protein